MFTSLALYTGRFTVHSVRQLQRIKRKFNSQEYLEEERKFLILTEEREILTIYASPHSIYMESFERINLQHILNRLDKME